MRMNLELLNVLLWHNKPVMRGRVCIIHISLGQEGFVSQQREIESSLSLET